VIAAPPLSAGGVHSTTACVLPAVPITDVGAPGVVRGVIVEDALDAEPAPAALVAVTVKVYAEPFVRPVTVHWSGPLDQVHDRFSGLVVTV
jgi:hypothetical protein